MRRAFKTAWFAKAARKARIKDDELCDAIVDVTKGLAEDLGGGVFKNASTRICIAASSWRKAADIGSTNISLLRKTRANIEDEELQDLRSLAKIYAALDDRQLIDLLESAALVEICHGDKNSV